MRTVLAGRGDVVAAYLFGSVARGTATPTSDVDVAILLAADPPSTIDGLQLGLEGELERGLGLPVQLVVLNRAPCDLVHRVLRDGVLLVDRDPGARIRFEVDARNRYFDLQPFLRRYRRFSVDAATLTDSDLIAKRLAFIETRTHELTIMARLDRVHDDLKEERFVVDAATNRLEDLTVFVAAVRKRLAS